MSVSTGVPMTIREGVERSRPAAELAVIVRRHALLAGWIAVAVGVRLVFWVATDRTWEDALITLAHVRNAVEGIGLTHHPGEGLVHGFTSALSVIIPLAGEILQTGWGLTALRLASVAAAIASLVYANGIAGRLGLGPWPTSLALAYLALNQNHILYGMAGMETQVAVAVVLAAAYHVLAGHHVRAGLAGGLAVLARPDLLLLTTPVLAWAASGGARSFLRTSVAAASLVLPWIVLTTLYYGSPVPHTIPAKALVWSPLPRLGGSIGDMVALVGERATVGLASTIRSLTPMYEDSFVVATPVPMALLLALGATMLILTVIGGWLTRRVPNWWPILIFVAGFAAYRAFMLPANYFDWYLPPFTALCVLLAAAALQRMQRRTPVPARALCVVLIVGAAAHLPFSIPLESRIQADVEDGVRREVGLFLGEVMGPDDEFTAESAGYLGWYSRRTIWDQPGLTSPTAYAATRQLEPANRRVEGLVDALRPDWAVLRPAEWSRLEQDFPDAASCYVPVRAFGEPGRDRIGWAGLEKVSLDWSFTVYRRDGCDQVSE